jgi:cytochrome b pre-mRNA-processing protein 3
MLRSLLPGLTAPADTATDLFAAITREARAEHWYVEGQVPDTLDGRFAMLATIAALVIVRLERADEHGVAASVALTERFVEVMESEHREMGLGDPKLGRTVRKLVSGLARRVELWRAAIGRGEWIEAARASVHGRDFSSAALDHCAEDLRRLWSMLDRLPDEALFEGRLA